MTNRAGSGVSSGFSRFALLSGKIRGAGIRFARLSVETSWAANATSSPASATLVASRWLIIHLHPTQVPNRPNPVEKRYRLPFGRFLPYKRGGPMYSYPRSRKALESDRLSYSIKSADGETRVVYDTRTVLPHSLEKHAVTFSELTLDDFGGRSDALGG
jgi:hypothetical protein